MQASRASKRLADMRILPGALPKGPFICRPCSAALAAAHSGRRTPPSRAFSCTPQRRSAPAFHPPSPRRLSAFWAPTQRAPPASDSGPPSPSDLLVRAGFVRQAQAGVFHLLPLGQRVQSKLEHVLDQAMAGLGASKLSLATLSREALWRRSGRLGEGDDAARAELFRLRDRRGTALLLSPTHEEEVTAAAAEALASHRDLPLRVYQVGRKFRDEARPRQGLLRAREFVMKDLYTFDAHGGAALATYGEVGVAYAAFFAALGLRVLVARALSGAIGGDLSHEYHLPSPLGEDAVVACAACGLAANVETLPAFDEGRAPPCPACDSNDTHLHTTIELAHTFHLGTRYSAPLGAQVAAPDGALVDVHMGCHGVGVTRLVGTVAAHLSDAKGLNWPRAIAPFEAAVLAAGDGVGDAAGVRDGLEAAGVDAVADDRAKGLAWKMNDADLVGYPVLVVLGRRWAEGVAEVQCRRLGVKEELKAEDVAGRVRELLEQL